jgi:AcrR family transcriptional regulator
MAEDPAAPQAEGLRERKKRRTRRTISDTAIDLFLRRGFDNVSVVEIALAAEISKRTLFSYFPTKEDLVLHRFADHEDEASRVVRDRPADQDPLTALHQHWLRALDRRDAMTGLIDLPQTLALYHLVNTTSSLVERLVRFIARGEDALTDALREANPTAPPLAPRLAAVQIIAVQRELARANLDQLTSGHTADELHAEAVRAADHAFTLLRHGLHEHYGQPG